MGRSATTGELADIGVVGGGQLARMLAERAAKLGLTTAVLDPAPDCAAAPLAALHITAGFADPEGLRRLALSSRVTTFDIELGNADALMRLEDEGHRILPRPQVLAIIQDKLRQREFLSSRRLPVPRFADLPEPTDEAMRRFGFPLVQKARRGGYDGRGVAVLRGECDLGRRITAPSMVEDLIPIARELAVLVARSRTGEMACYPACELFPDPESHVLDALLFPAQADAGILKQAQDVAREAIEVLEGVGIFAVELFVDTDARLWINEVSPRPHNAGHVTIEAALTCQFEQHLRAILGFPLGSTQAIQSAAMVNLLGPAGLQGPARIDRLERALSVPGVRLHLYGKPTVRPGRKMGHLTALGEDPRQALERAWQARSELRFTLTGEMAA